MTTLNRFSLNRVLIQNKTEAENMNGHHCYASTITPQTSNRWQQISDDQRLELITQAITLYQVDIQSILLPKEAMQDGQVIFKFLVPIGADKRGTILLDLEEFLKKEADPGITIWIETLDDRNSLRHLRGVEVNV